MLLAAARLAAPLVRASRPQQHRTSPLLRRCISAPALPPRAMSSSSAADLPRGDAPPPNFFRDQVYVNAKAEKRVVPWDIGGPQPALGTLPEGTLHGRVLDVGSGTGDNAIWLASLPAVMAVTCVDLSPDAVEEANARLSRAAPPPRAPLSFAVGDVFALPAELTGFDTLLDSAVFHCIGDDDAQRRYLAAVTPRIKLNGRAVMLVFSDANEDPWMGPRRIAEAHARAMWTAAGWRVDSLDMAQRYKDAMGRNGGLGGHAMLMTATRVA
jgi:SAM-dependent methyltransferase